MNSKPTIQVFLKNLTDEKAAEMARRMPFIKRDFKVKVVYLANRSDGDSQAPGGEEGIFKDSGVELIGAQVAPLPPDDRLNHMEAFLKLMKGDPPDAALATLPCPEAAAFLISARAAGVPLVLAEFDDHPCLLSSLEELSALYFSDLILPASRHLQRVINHTLPTLADRTQNLLPHSADTTYIQLTKEDRIRLRKNLHVDTEKKMITMIAPFDQRRDHHTLLEACAQLKAGGHDFILLLVGDGPERQHIADQIYSLQLQEQVFIMEDTGDHQDILCATDIFALCTHFEGNNVPLLEAMAQGLAIAATDAAGINDLIRDGRSGRLAKPKDAAAFAQALIDLLAQEKIRKKVGSVARKCVENRGNLNYFMPIFLKMLKTRVKALPEKGKKKSRARDGHLGRQYIKLQQQIRSLWSEVAPGFGIGQAAQMLDGFPIHTQVDLLEKLCEIRSDTGPLALLVRPLEKVLSDRFYERLPLLEMRILEKLAGFYMELSYAEGTEKLIERIEQNMGKELFRYHFSRDRFAGLRANERLSRLYEFVGKPDQREFYRLEIWDYMRPRDGEEDAYFHQQNATFLESLGELKLAARELRKDTLSEVRLLASLPIAHLAPEAQAVAGKARSKATTLKSGPQRESKRPAESHHRKKVLQET